MSSGASWSEQIAPGRQAGFLNLVSRCTVEDICIAQMFCANSPYANTREVERQRAPEQPWRRQICGRAAASREVPRPDRAVHPRWPAAIALLIVGALYAVISGALTFGPRAFLLALVSVLLVPLLSAHQQGHHLLARLLGLGLVSLVTVVVVVSVFLLISSSLSGQTPAPTLLQDAALLWIINMVTFAVWYWEIDGGGPAQRRQEGHVSQDFLFPQMNLDHKTSRT